jgi:site-specific DNA-methyltransferase (adenine-specific)
MRGANPGNVWEFSHVHYCNINRKPHPTQKPEGLFERMILASSNPGDTVLDPFTGSGTALRVCQQTHRNGIGIDINPEYIEMTKKRLAEEFRGFDSIDERMKRVPNDLNDPNIREEYIRNHIEWFLKNHPDAIKEFMQEVRQKYETKMIDSGQMNLFDLCGTNPVTATS